MKYVLTFTPLKHFFFGNEKTFREDYVAISEYFPQPVQVLGALRLSIAQQYGIIKQYKNGRYPKHPKQMRELTGSAKAPDFKTNGDLGKISFISPMFITDSECKSGYFPTPFDVKITQQNSHSSIMDDSGKIISVNYPQKLSLSYYKPKSLSHATYLDGYNPKEASPQMLANANFWDAYLNQKDRVINGALPYDVEKQSGLGVFVPHTQVGIALNHKQTIDGKFYKKIDYTLARDFCFGCILEFEGEIRDDIVQLGAESSLFRMRVQPLDSVELQNHPLIKAMFQPQNQGEKIVAIGDMIAQDSSCLNAKFALIPYLKHMAMLRSIKGRFDGLHTTHTIIPAGSVIYTHQESSISLYEGAYIKMGYNQFIRV